MRFRQRLDPELERAVAMQEHLEAFVDHSTRTFGPNGTLVELTALAAQLAVERTI